MKRLLHLLLWVWLCSSVTSFAAITVTYASADATGGFGDNSLTLNPPAGTQAGDILVAQIATPGDAVTSFSAPAGWTLVSTASSIGNANVDQRIYYLTLTGAAASSYSWTIWDWTSRSAGVIYSVRGALAPNCGASNTANCAGARQTGGGSTVIAPNISSPASYPAGSLRMAFFADAHGSTTIKPTLENSATAGRYYRAGSGANGMGIHGSYYVMASAGNGGGQSATLGNGQSNVGSTLLLASSTTSSIHHIEVELTDTPLTCTPSTLTVKACTNAACTTLSSASTTVNLSASSGTLGNTSLTFTGSTTTTLRQTSAATVIVDASSTPAETNPTVCTLDGITLAGCGVPFVDSGLLLTIPPQVAGVTSSGATRFSVAAVKKSDSSLACVPAFASVTRSVKFWSGYTNPASGTRTLAVNGTTVATTSAGTNVSLNFDATGTATGLTLNYADAGQLTLNAQYTGSAGTNDTGLAMTGSAPFVTVPYAFCIDSPDANWSCAAADTSCAKFTSAGTPFNLRVTAKAYQVNTAKCSMPTTLNYVQSNLALSSTIVAPSGGVNASVSPSTISITSGGSATQATSISEVGVFTITATPPPASGSPPTGGYFSLTVPPDTSSNFGRFVPAGFAITVPTFTARSDTTCPVTVPPNPVNSSFSYLGETVKSAFALKAVAVDGTTTTNYRGNFSRLNLAPVTTTPANWTGLAIGAQSGATLLNPSATTSASRMSVACTGCGATAVLVNGSGDLTLTLTPLRPYGSNTPDGPYAAVFTLAARDADGVGMLSPTYAWDGAGGADAVSIGDMTGGVSTPTNLYFGRVRTANAYGSSLLNLPVPAYVEYWNGTRFVTNSSDSCTRMPVPATVSLSSTTPASLYCNGGVGLYGGLTGVSAKVGVVTAGNVATVSSGTATINLSKPTNSGGGYLDLVVSVPDYLKYNVDGVDQGMPGCTATGDSYLHDDNPRARIRFGARTNDKVLYLREVY